MSLVRATLFLWTWHAWAQQYSISTFAGGGVLPSPIAAKEAPSEALAVGVDLQGTVYLAESTSVYKLDSKGILTRIAGTGRHGTGGDGGPATDAAFWNLSALAVDAAGNIYVADEGVGRIRKISPDGKISAFAGSGALGYAGDGGPAVNAQFGSSLGLAFPAIAADTLGNVYIVDFRNYVVRKVSSAGTITTVAGNGKPGYSGDGGPATQAQLFPRGVAADEKGNIFISAGTVIRRVNSAGIISTIAGTGVSGKAGDGGPAVAAQFTNASGMALGRLGSLYIVDSDRLRKIAPDGTVTRVAGGGREDPNLVDGLLALNVALTNFTATPAVSATGAIYLSPARGRVYQVTPQGAFQTVAGNGQPYWGDGGSSTAARLGNISGITSDPKGNVYLSDSSRVRRISPDGKITLFAGGASPGDGIGDGGPATSAAFSGAEGIAAGPDGSVYVADYLHDRIRRISPDGTISTVGGTVTIFGPSVNTLRPVFVAVDPVRGDVYYTWGSVPLQTSRLTPDGKVSVYVGGGSKDRCHGDPPDGAQAAIADYCPTDVAVDNSGAVYVRDPFSGTRVRKVDPKTGALTVVAGSGTEGFSGDGGPAVNAQFSGSRIAVDGAGNLYIAANDRVRKVSAKTGIITTIAGTGGGGYSGDGGPALRADIIVDQIAVDALGNVYLYDWWNHVVRVLRPLPPLTAGGVLNAASFAYGDVAPDEFVTLSGTDIAGLPALANSSALPQSLGGVTVTIVDSKGARLPAGLQYVSTGQINFVMPSGAATGAGVLALEGPILSTQVPITIANVAPGLFAANSDGHGAPAGEALGVRSDSSRIVQPLATCGASSGSCLPRPIEWPADLNGLYLTLYGTGFRHAKTVTAQLGARTVTVPYFGAQGEYPGLDQLNLQVPSTLRNAGAVALRVTADGTPANALTIAFGSADLVPLDCGQEGQLRSVAVTGPATLLRFINSTSSVRKVYWLDLSGRRVLFHTLAAGESVSQGGYPTHPWVVTDAANACVAIFVMPSLWADARIVR